jgi:hypothetical protein
MFDARYLTDAFGRKKTQPKLLSWVFYGQMPVYCLAGVTSIAKLILLLAHQPTGS